MTLTNAVDNVAAMLKGAVIEDGSATHLLRLTKEAGRMLNSDKMRIQLDPILAGVNTAGRMAKGWKIAYATDPETNEDWYTHETVVLSNIQTTNHFHVYFRIDYTPERKRPDAVVEVELQNIASSIASKGNFPKWRVTQLDGREWKGRAEDEDMPRSVASEIGYVPFVMPNDWSASFAHLYGLEDHIERVRRTILAAQESDWQHRFNSALIGPPGCGKSDICQSIKKALGEDAVLEFDGTSTTMAGAQRELAEREELPRIILVEEIEKAPDASLAWLLSVLDIRGEVRKTTARTQLGGMVRDTRMLAICTVNDLETFQKVAFGALASRFANKIFFNRPSRETRERILLREIERVKGDVRWIAPAIDFAEAIGTDDPRELIAICMCGREALLDGSYQAMMLRTSRRENES